jgi:hypothetical protein
MDEKEKKSDRDEFKELLETVKSLADFVGEDWRKLPVTETNDLVVRALRKMFVLEALGQCRYHARPAGYFVIWKN